MKICLINNLYPPHVRGGAEQVLAKTVEGLLRAGHKVVLVTTSPDGEEKEVDGDLTIWRFRPRNLFFYTHAHRYGWITRLLWHVVDMFHIGSARYVKSVLEQEKPDVVHTHNLMGVGFLVPRVIRKLGLRHLHTVHDVQLVEPSGIILKTREKSFRYTGPHTKLYSWFMRKLMGSPDIVISPSQFLLDFYTRRGFFKKSKTVLLRNPVTFQLKRKTSAPETKEGKTQFLYLGQVEEHKGVRFLVETFHALLQEHQDIILHVVGDGSLYSELSDRVRDVDGIVMHGRKGRGELPNLFEQTDMMIVPSLCYENSPTVIFESFAFGVPVLASDIEGIAELIEEKKNGMTFAAGESTSLSKRITEVAANKSNIKEMGLQTHSYVKQLSLVQYVERLLGYYRS